MSVCGQTEEESGSEEPPAAGARDMYEQKPVSKVVRVLTVLAYLLSVSLAAILLSVYYVCVWQSPKLPPLNDTGEDGRVSAQRADPPHAPPHYNLTDFSHWNNETRGGNSTVSEAPTPPAEFTSLPADSEPPDPSPTFPELDPTLLEDNSTTWTVPNDTQQLNMTDQR